MKTGLDQLTILKKKLRGKSVGLLCHAASVNSKHLHLIDLLKDEKTIRLKALFGPEHGLWGVAQDMESVAHKNQDTPQGLPVYSLYGSGEKSLKPNLQWLKDIDVVVCDLQDVGSRYYTFIYSIALMMKTAAAAHVSVLVLDRPNPINGVTVEGGMIDQGFESFVGMYPIANRHGMTVGELSCYFNETEQLKSDLSILKLQDWNRTNYLDELNASWVLPSPNMPTLETAIVYPGMCLLEATELSEGRGTTRPFEIFGAPFIDSEALQKRLLDYKLKGVTFRPLRFKPTFQKWAGKVCSGLQLHVTDRKTFAPYLTGLAILHALCALHPQDFAWRKKPYEFIEKIPAIDLLTGSARFRCQLEDEAPWKAVLETYEAGKIAWMRKRREYLLY